MESFLPLENKILSRIYGRDRGWAFSKKYFAVATDKAFEIIFEMLTATKPLFG